MKPGRKEKHDIRRREVAASVCRLLARVGMEGLTVRDVAAEVGCSTHVVSHYFRNKRELLLFTLREVSARTAARVEAARQRGASIQECIEQILPLEEESRIDALAWFSFWGMAVRDAEFATEERRHNAFWRATIKEIIAERVGAQTLDPDALTQASYQLQKAVVGLSLHGVFDPVAWAPDHIRRLLAAEIAALRLEPPDACPPARRGLEAENERLRQLLVDALLEVASLRDSARSATAG